MRVFYYKNEKKTFFRFSILKISRFLSLAVNFLKAVERNWEKNHGQVEIIIEKLKKFGVHRYTPQFYADSDGQKKCKIMLMQGLLE